MSCIYRRKYNATINGKRVKKQSKCWYVKYRDPDGVEHRAKGYPDKEATRQMGARLEKEAALASEGVVDRYKEHRKRPLLEHLEDFRQALLAKGDTVDHARQTKYRIETILTGCGFVLWSDMQASRLQKHLAGLHADDSGIGAQTYNYYLQAVKQFCRWMVQDGRAAESPIEHLKSINARVDRRRDRRSFEPDELKRLLKAKGLPQPVMFHDVRWGKTNKGRFVWVLLNSGSSSAYASSNALRVKKRSRPVVVAWPDRSGSRLTPW